jgi:hypothetical protein
MGYLFEKLRACGGSQVQAWGSLTLVLLLLVLAGSTWVGAKPVIGCALTIRQGQPAHHTGTNGDDRCDGLPGRDIMRGLRGDDRLRGLGSRDVVKGNRGDDRLLGKRGADDVLGGRGSDLLKGGRGDDRLVGGRGADLICLGRGSDWAGTQDGIRDRVFSAHDNDEVTSDRKDRISRTLCPTRRQRPRRPE